LAAGGRARRYGRKGKERKGKSRVNKTSGLLRAGHADDTDDLRVLGVQRGTLFLLPVTR
jgi:hypothetical protein